MEKVICKKECLNCGKEVFIMSKQRLDGRNIYCSNKCVGEYKKKQNLAKEGYLNCECPICKKRFHLNQYQKNKGKNHYCSRECHRIAKMEYMKGEKNHQYGLKGNKNFSWKSDERITTYGYKKIRVEEHPFKDKDDFVFEHRLIAEKYLLNDENSIEINGIKYLKPELEVHHKNENKLDNRIENLIILTKNEHMSIHSKERAEKICKKVNKLDLEGNILETYNSVKEAGEKNKIFPQNICSACKKNQKTAGGYKWEYIK